MKKTKNAAIQRGEVFYLEKPAIIVVVISNKLHNLLSKYLVALLATDKNIDQVRESLEVAGDLKGKKIKILVSCFYTVNKETLQNGVLWGKLEEKAIDKLDNKVRSILDL